MHPGERFELVVDPIEDIGADILELGELVHQIPDGADGLAPLRKRHFLAERLQFVGKRFQLRILLDLIGRDAHRLEGVGIGAGGFDALSGGFGVALELQILLIHRADELGDADGQSAHGRDIGLYADLRFLERVIERTQTFLIHLEAEGDEIFLNNLTGKPSH